MRSVAQRIAIGGSFFGKGFKIGDLKGEMGKVGADLDRAAGAVFADLDLLLALRGLEKDEFRAAATLAATDFGEAEDITVKPNGLFEVLNAVTGVEELRNHWSAG